MNRLFRWARNPWRRRQSIAVPLRPVYEYTVHAKSSEYQWVFHPGAPRLYPEQLNAYARLVEIRGGDPSAFSWSVDRRLLRFEGSEPVYCPRYDDYECAC